MNSPHPSTTCPPTLAAWFFKHSLYVIDDDGGVEVDVIGGDLEIDLLGVGAVLVVLLVAAIGVVACAGSGIRSRSLVGL